MYHHGNLSRVSIARSSKASNGKICNRGVAYLYEFTKSGHKYAAFLRDEAKQRHSKQRRENIEFLKLMKLIELDKIVGPNLGYQELEKFEQLLFPEKTKRTSERFAPKLDPLLVDFILQLVRDVRARQREQLTDITKQIQDQQLREERDTIAREVREAYKQMIDILAARLRKLAGRDKSPP
jgi:hypothetical protein